MHILITQYAPGTSRIFIGWGPQAQGQHIFLAEGSTWVQRAALRGVMGAWDVATDFWMGGGDEASAVSLWLTYLPQNTLKSKKTTNLGHFISRIWEGRPLPTFHCEGRVPRPLLSTLMRGRLYDFRGPHHDFRERQHDFGERHSDFWGRHDMFLGRHYKLRGCIMTRVL